MSGISIKAIGTALPGENGIKGNVLDNVDILKGFYGTFGQFFKKKEFKKMSEVVKRLGDISGIKTRNILSVDIEKYPNTYLGVAATAECLKIAGVDPKKVEGFFYVTDTPDFVFPSPGLAVIKALGIKPKQFANSSMACSSAAFALQTATEWITKGLCNNVVITAVDVTSRLRHKKNRVEPYMFGDDGITMYLEKGKGGFTFSNISVETEAADLLVHKPFYLGELGVLNYGLGDDNTDNDVGLKILGDIESEMWPRLLNDFLKNSNDALTPGSKICTPQAGKNVVINGTKIFKAENGIDISNKLLVNSAYTHGNTGAAAFPLSIKESYDKGVLNKDDEIFITVFGVGGINTVLKYDPKSDIPIKTVRIENRGERPDLQEIINKRLAKERTKNKKNSLKIEEYKSSDVFSKNGNGAPETLTNLERIVRSVSKSLNL